ncbi:MAG: DEAD/DEAH box helicase, partial [Clostridia bacterium]|nr:DEAD/DEAH box helicase [Clostridia bacterium]
DRRLAALSRIADGATHVVTTMDALMQLFPRSLASFDVELGETERDILVEKLLSFGYERVESVSAAGLFAVRGDIVDVFPVGSASPYRVNFFGDEIEQIKTFDLVSGESIDHVTRFSLYPAKETTWGENATSRLAALFQAEIAAAPRDARARLQTIAEELLEGVATGKSEATDFLLPLSETVTANLLDLMPVSTVVFFDECKLIADGATMVEREFYERYAELKSAGEVFSFTERQHIPLQTVVANLTKNPCVALQNITATVPFFTPQHVLSVKASATPKYSRNLAALSTDVSGWKITGYRIAVFAGSQSRAETLVRILEEQGVTARYHSFIPADFRGAVITAEPLKYGCIYHDSKLAVIGENDVFRETKKEKRVKRKRNDFFTAPEIGDYAVHETHGVGLVKGTKKITTTDGTKDYVMLEYGGGDMLYVPVEEMDSLSRYTGGDNAPKLNRIGGKEFARIKERVRESVKKLAIDLKALYKKRFDRSGFRFSPDSALTREFDEDFPYDLTPDQAQSTEEILQDMQSGKVMDRLLCGDVGYGKTEVAFRAAFRAVLDGKQVALLCPTTILSQQHYETAEKRFRNFGIRIAVLNRFKTDKESEEILTRLMEGKIDFIIGTHRLLSKDVVFADLGLLILDEEQRFGVEHKEKIKAVKADVDCLSM